MQPAHDRRRRQRPDRRRRAAAAASASGSRASRRQSLHGLMLEHRPRRRSSPAWRARLTSWIDMMLSPPSAKKLSSMPTRGRPRTSANSAHRISSCGVRGARTAAGVRSGAGSARRSSLPFGVSGSALENHKRRRHHVIRQATRQREHAAPPHQRRTRPPQPRRPPAACSPGHPRAPSPPPAPHRMPHQRRLDLARLNAKAAQLHLLVGPPNELQHPVARQRAKSPVRYIRLPAAPNGSATNRSAVSPRRPT